MLNNEYLDYLRLKGGIKEWKPDLTRGEEAVEHEQHMKILEAIVNGSVAAGQTSSMVSNDILRELWHHLRRIDRFFGPKKE